MCKNISLTLRDTQLKRTAKAISNQTYPVGFNRNPELLNKKTNSNGRAFLEKFFIKESSILIGLENFGVMVFSIMGGLGWYSLHHSKIDQISTHQSPLHQIFTSYPSWVAVTVSHLKFLYQFVVSVEVYTYVKNQHHSSNQSWHIVDLILRITFGKPRYAWPHSYKWTGSNRCICVCLTTCKKWTSYLGLFKLVALNHFGHVWPHPLEMIEKNCYFFDSLPHAKNFITQLILKAKLTDYLSSLWTYSGMPDYTHLKQPTNICCIHGPL